MKLQKLTPLASLLSVIALIVFSGYKITSQSKEVLTQLCEGPTITTADLHNLKMGTYDPKVYQTIDHSWYKHYILTVSAPTGWHFSGKPYVVCKRDNQGACSWNHFDARRLIVTKNEINEIIADAWAGSRSIDIALVCQATKD